MAYASIGFALALGVMITLFLLAEERKNGPQTNRLVPIRVRTLEGQKRRRSQMQEVEEETIQGNYLEWFFVAVFFLVLFSFAGTQL